jgi:hypothetical protein
MTVSNSTWALAPEPQQDAASSKHNDVSKMGETTSKSLVAFRRQWYFRRFEGQVG